MQVSGRAATFRMVVGCYYLNVAIKFDGIF